MARRILLSITLLFVTGISAFAGWRIYPAADTPPTDPLGQVWLNISTEDVKSRAELNSEMMVLADGNTKLTVTVSIYLDKTYVGHQSIGMSIVAPSNLHPTLDSWQPIPRSGKIEVIPEATRDEGFDSLTTDINVEPIDPKDISSVRTAKLNFTFRGQPWSARNGTWLHLRTLDASFTIFTRTNTNDEYTYTDPPRLRGDQSICFPEPVSAYVTVAGTPPDTSVDQKCLESESPGRTDTLLRNAGGQDQRDQKVFLSGILLGVAVGGVIALLQESFDLIPRKSSTGRRTGLEEAGPSASISLRSRRPVAIARRRRSLARVTARRYGAPP